MMPFEERWGLRAIEILKEWFDAKSKLTGRAPNEERASAELKLTEGTLAWKIACELQLAYDTANQETIGAVLA